jgi:HlyD family secretion protein
MPKIDSMLVTLGIASAVVIGIAAFVKPAPERTAGVSSGPSGGGQDWSSAARADAGAQRPQWAASATGRIEPKDGEVRIASQLSGRVVEVAVKAGDAVKKGDTLVRLDDEDHWIRHAAAEAEAHVRKRERDEDPDAKGAVPERRRMEDATYESDRALFKVRMEFDEVQASFRAGRGVNQLAVDEVRGKIKAAEEKALSDRTALARLLAKGAPLPNRLEASLAAARMDLALAEQAIERTRIRAPQDGTVLSVPARAGELTVASPEAVLVSFGDLSGLKVRAEVEERDAPKIKVGQRVVVRADAYPDREFEGKVTLIGSALGTPRISTRGPRRPNDVEVLEVQAMLDGTPPLLTGMRVDVFFRGETTVSAAPGTKN